MLYIYEGGFMNKENIFPIKYAVLELKAKNWKGEDVTKGYIVSKCYVVGYYTYEDISMLGQKRENIWYKVIFPYKDYEGFIESLRDYNEDIGKRVILNDDFNFESKQIDKVFKVFNTYEDAKEMAENYNQSLKSELFRYAQRKHKHGLAFNSQIHDAIHKTYNNLVSNFERELERCYQFEELSLANTEDMIITRDMDVKKLRLQKEM